MKNFFTLLILFTLNVNAQVGVGTPMPDASTMLDVVANDKGILIPRVPLNNTTDATTITNGNKESLLVFNTQTINDVTPGYYYWYINKWQRLIATDTLPPLIVSTLVDNGNGTFTYTNEIGGQTIIDFPTLVDQYETITTITNNNDGSFTYINENNTPQTINLNGNFWSVNGNSGTNYLFNYLGTTDNQDLVFKRNNVGAGFLRNDNTAFGVNSLPYQTTFLPNSWNAAFGNQALSSLTSAGYYNTAVGARALKFCTTGTYNAAIGMDALGNIINGHANLGMGYAAMRGGTTCSYNVALGGQCMNNNNDDFNVGIGFQTAYNKVNGQNNIAVGARTMFTSQNASNNVVIGSYSLYLVPNPITNNVIIGNSVGALSNVSSVTGNVIIGNNVLLPPTLTNNVIIADGNGTERMRVDANGNVGLGTSTPSAKLEINGKIKATDVNFTGLSTYLDEVAATAGGLTTGDMYKTPTGELRIKL